MDEANASIGNRNILENAQPKRRCSHNLGSNCPNLYKVSQGACSELIVINLVITSKKFYKYS